MSLLSLDIIAKEGKTMVTIKYEYGHYTIYVNGNFYCTADTREEAEREKQQAEKELEQSG